MDVMFDIETLSTTPTAAITQIGAVFFEARSRGRILNKKDETFNMFVKVDPMNGEINHDTLAFWFKQISENPKHPMATGVHLAGSLAVVLSELVDWPRNVLGSGYSWDQIETVWGKPADFDIACLRSGFARCGWQEPWNYRATRCARTLFHLKGGEPTIDWTGLVSHDAADDAIGQAMQVQVALST